MAFLESEIGERDSALFDGVQVANLLARFEDGLVLLPRRLEISFHLQNLSQLAHGAGCVRTKMRTACIHGLLNKAMCFWHMASCQLKITEPVQQIFRLFVIQGGIDLQRFAVKPGSSRQIATEIQDVRNVADGDLGIWLIPGLLEMHLGLPIEPLGPIEIALVGKVNRHVIEYKPRFGMFAQVLQYIECSPIEGNRLFEVPVTALGVSHQADRIGCPRAIPRGHENVVCLVA